MTAYHILAYLAIAYYIGLYSVNMLHLLVGYRAAMRWKKMGYLEEAHRLSRSRIVPPITLAADLDSVGEDSVQWVDHVLSQRFPEMEVIVTFRHDDDERVKELIGNYFLRRVDRVYRRTLEAPEAIEVYQSDDRRLMLVRTHGATSGDSLNLALDLSRYPVFGIADRSPRLEDDSLLCMVRPLMEGEVTVPAVMGVELPLDMEREDLLPPRRMTRFALMESLRVQLGYMAGAPYFGGPVTAYGSLILYRKKDLTDAGGFKPGLSCMEAEMDMSLRLHRLMHDRKRKYRFVFLPQLVVQRPFPRSLRECFDDFRARQQAISTALSSETGMMYRARYGRIGMIQLPSFWLFVKMAPLLGFAAFTISILLFAFGRVGWPVFAVFLASATLYPALVGAGAVVAARRELGILKGQGAALYGYAFLAQFWYRQLISLAPFFASGGSGEE
ncbi:MAG: glycosyltransferase family 2 protein [Actinobacteria bacterium]|nr:glycosyltransferase family 2 protein [Actinomycetota bacterium]